MNFENAQQLLTLLSRQGHLTLEDSYTPQILQEACFTIQPQSKPPSQKTKRAPPRSKESREMKPVDSSLCMARIWNGGMGKQCAKSRKSKKR